MILHAIKKVMAGPWAWLEVATLAVMIFLVLIMVPVLTTPGNDLLFQLSILEVKVLIIMIVLSLMNALLIQMQLYIRKTVREKQKLHVKAGEKATLIGIITTSITATLACAACYSSVLALVGLGTAATIVKYQLVIALVALALSLVAIYYSAKRINNHCAVCHI